MCSHREVFTFGSEKAKLPHVLCQAKLRMYRMLICFPFTRKRICQTSSASPFPVCQNHIIFTALVEMLSIFRVFDNHLGWVSKSFFPPQCSVTADILKYFFSLKFAPEADVARCAWSDLRTSWALPWFSDKLQKDVCLTDTNRDLSF